MHAISTGSLVMFGAAKVTPAGEAFWYGCYGALLFLIIGCGYFIYLKKQSKFYNLVWQNFGGAYSYFSM
jgi:hypothetical protein